MKKLYDNGGITNEGKIATGYNQIGGGIQTQTPLTVKELMEIGMLKKYVKESDILIFKR